MNTCSNYKSHDLSPVIIEDGKIKRLKYVERDKTPTGQTKYSMIGPSFVLYEGKSAQALPALGAAPSSVGGMRRAARAGRPLCRCWTGGHARCPEIEEVVQYAVGAPASASAYPGCG